MNSRKCTRGYRYQRESAYNLYTYTIYYMYMKHALQFSLEPDLQSCPKYWLLWKASTIIAQIILNAHVIFDAMSNILAFTFSEYWQQNTWYGNYQQQCIILFELFVAHGWILHKFTRIMNNANTYFCFEWNMWHLDMYTKELHPLC